MAIAHNRATCTEADDACDRPPIAAQSKKLIDGTFENATITVKGGIITAIMDGENIIYQAADQCCDDGVTAAPGGTAAPVIGLQFAPSDCIVVTGVGTTLDPFVMSLQDACKPPDATNGATFERCGIKIVNGIVQTFAVPVMGIATPDGTVKAELVAGSNGCVVALSVPVSTTQFQRQRAMCCKCAGGGTDGQMAGMAVVEIIGEFAPYVLQMCGWTGTGGPPTLAFTPGPHDTIEAAQAAMNAAACSGSCIEVGGVGAP